jgi:hypothetical protein
MKPMPSHVNRRRWGIGGSLLVGGLLAILGLLVAPAPAPAAAHPSLPHDLHEIVKDFRIFVAAKVSDFRHQPDARRNAFELRMLLEEFVEELAAGEDIDVEATFFQLLDFLTNGS